MSHVNVKEVRYLKVETSARIPSPIKSPGVYFLPEIAEEMKRVIGRGKDIKIL
jgi:hypothetical protein